MFGEKGFRGFMGPAWMFVGIFVVGIIAAALISPYASAVYNASIDTNVVRAPGASTVLLITTTLFAITILGLFMGSKG